ncbi:MAG: pyridoxal phosphate-dependent aminotransferase [DPANN group archaeon]|nr:pyridoxal phosphate-dependent aminotransferase [DPANN group archaeon]
MTHISEREQELPDTLMLQLQELASEHKDIISLSIGEPDFKTPKPILAAAKNSLARGTHYSPAAGRTDLRKAIAQKLRKENKIHADWENVIVTAGSQEGLMAALLATVDPTEEVILASPGYLGYVPAIELADGVPVFVRLREQDGWQVNPDEIKKKISKKTVAIILNTPANPTGTVLKRKVLEEVADIAVQNDLYIFSDEAYEKIIYGDAKHISAGSLNGMSKYVVTFNTFSKTYAMCGFRLGYMRGPKEFVKAVSKVHHYLEICAPHTSQLAGLAALKLPNKYISEMVREYDRRKKLIVQRLNEIGLRTVNPEGTFYALADISDFSSSSIKFAEDLIKKARVACVPGTEFGPFGEGLARFSYANDYKLIKQAMNRIETVLK